MKLKTTILLTFLALAASCQEPDVECYSQGYVDSILLVNTQNCNSVIAEQQRTIDSLKSLVYYQIIQDTAVVEVQYDYIVARIDKSGHQVNLTLSDFQRKKRIQARYDDYDCVIRIMNDTVGVGYLHINEENTKGNAYVDFED
jgi:hypothetical protein